MIRQIVNRCIIIRLLTASWLSVALTLASLNPCPSAYAQELEAPKSDLGIGTEGVWKTYRYVDGLVSNWVWSIIQDKEGAIWFGTFGGGVSRFDGRCFQTINSRDGLVNDVIRSLYLDRSGQIWMGTDNGAIRFTPNKIPPPVYITQVLVDEKLHLLPRGQLTLSAGIRRVALDFHAISFKTRPGAMKYFYQLVGPVETTRRVVSTSWQGPTNDETVEYFKLKPGKYSFKVQAVDRDLNYSEIASLQMVLPPLWYQKGWVRGMLLGGGLAFLAAFGLVTWRLLVHRIITRRLERKLREQQAREAQLQMLRYQLNPHFLFNAFNSIIALVSEDHHGAQKMMIQLSEYFRYSLLKPNSLGGSPLQIRLLK